MPATPFTDPQLLATITELAAQVAPTSTVVCDIGCGRGTTTLALAACLAPQRLIALDQSPALLDTVRHHVAQAGHTVETVCADFHQLPLPQASVDMTVVAFCLYHSPRPEQFEGYRGRYVFHCHNAEHEDMGMMANFETI